MNNATVGDRYVPRSTWTTLSCATLPLLTTVLALSFAATLLTASLGTPDGVVPVAVGTIAAVAVGLALVRLFAFLEANGIPVLE